MLLADMMPTRRLVTAQHARALHSMEPAQNLGLCSTFAHEALRRVTPSSGFLNLCVGESQRPEEGPAAARRTPVPARRELEGDLRRGECDSGQMEQTRPALRNERPGFRTCGAPGRAGVGGRPPCEFTACLPFFANFHLNRALTPGAGAPPPHKLLDHPYLTQRQLERIGVAVCFFVRCLSVFDVAEEKRPRRTARRAAELGAVCILKAEAAFAHASSRATSAVSSSCATSRARLAACSCCR